METPEGFTKVGTGKYTKGDYTYTVNAETGAVTAKNGAEESGVVAMGKCQVQIQVDAERALKH